MPENTRLISKNGLCSLCREVAKDPRREPEEHPKIGRGRSQEEKVRFARRRGGNAGMEREIGQENTRTKSKEMEIELNIGMTI